MKKKISVLIADDNEKLNRELSDCVKSRSDMTLASQAYDGEEAYKLILETSPDAVILDLVMPKLDGIGIIKKLSNAPLPKHPKIIVYSISASAIEMAASVGGVSYCLLKPQSCERVCEVIRDVSSQHVSGAISIGERVISPVPSKDEEVDLETVVTDFIQYRRT